jgi:hypothetical protein
VPDGAEVLGRAGKGRRESMSESSDGEEADETTSEGRVEWDKDEGRVVERAERGS